MLYAAPRADVIYYFVICMHESDIKRRKNIFQLILPESARISYVSELVRARIFGTDSFVFNAVFGISLFFMPHKWNALDFYATKLEYSFSPGIRFMPQN